MNREQFEQLISQWLDERDNTELRARVLAAADQDPSLARTLAEWQRFDDVFRQNLPVPRSVDWDALKHRISAAVKHDDADNLDEALQSLSAIDDQVDWLRYKQRVSAAVGRSEVRPSKIRRRYWIGGAAALMATAAAVLLAILPTSEPPAGMSGVAYVAVGLPPPPDSGVAYVHVGVAEVRDKPSECFFVLDPVRTNVPSPETAGYY